MVETQEQKAWRRFSVLTSSEFEYVLRTVLDDMGELLVRKNKSYGPHNLAKFGDKGVLVRTSDKLERLIHMDRMGISTTAVGEDALDAWRDIAGYSLLMLVAAQLKDGGPASDEGEAR